MDISRYKTRDIDIHMRSEKTRSVHQLLCTAKQSIQLKHGTFRVLLCHTEHHYCLCSMTAIPTVALLPAIRDLLIEIMDDQRAHHHQTGIQVLGGLKPDCT